MSDTYQVARAEASVYVRVVGLANLRNTPMLDEFLKTEVADGATMVCIDLANCQGMDSTFMGTLVGYAGRMAEVDGRLVVVNPTEANTRLLDMLGVSSVVPVICAPTPEALEYVDLVNAPELSPVQRAEMMQQAHEHLVELSPANQAKFGTFLETLRGELERLKTDDCP